MRSAALLFALLLAGCASPPACKAPLEQRLVAQLFFGREIPGGGAVEARSFETFVAEEITPRFPAGFTLQDATGAWRDHATGVTIRENSTILTVIAPDDAGLRARIDAIADAYRRRFRQEAVGKLLQTGCASF